jgi:hypothetical protein
VRSVAKGGVSRTFAHAEPRFAVLFRGKDMWLEGSRLVRPITERLVRRVTACAKCVLLTSL